MINFWSAGKNVTNLESLPNEGLHHNIEHSVTFSLLKFTIFHNRFTTSLF